MKQLAQEKEYITKIIHDLKIPAVAQICALESIIKTSASKFTTQELELIELTLNSCIYMQKLIDTFSFVFKLNYEKITPNYSYFNFRELLNEIIKDFKILLKYSNLKIEIETQNEIEIYADKACIKSVIENILSNSIKNSYKNTVISIHMKVVKNEFIFETKNKSKYIEENILKEIFEKYKKYSSVYNKAGIGLGLYLSKEIINAHFGKMIAKSIEDDTNIFGFVLPLR